ncbi:MAG: dihydrolipoamide acetyltransferase family protein [bacterium]
MSIAVELPSLGESVYEGTIARWLVAEGEAVEVDQPIVEVTTDKVDAEIPAPSAGVIEKILASEGDVVEVGAVLARIDPEAKPSAAPSAEPSAPEPTPEPVAREGAAEPIATSGAGADEVPATPVARRMAEEARIDLREVEGTGSAGRVTKEDVLRFQEGADGAPAPSEVRPASESPSAPAAMAAAPPPSESAPSETSSQPPARSAAEAAPRPSRAQRSGPSFDYALQPGDRVIPMSPMRRIIADHMVYSKRTSPHVGTVAEVDLSRVVRLRSQHKKSFQETHGVSLTFLPFIVHATVKALREFPALNASVVEDAIVEKQDVHVGVATETEKGLVVPVVRHADRLSLAGTAMAIDDLATRAREKRLSADDLRGGTFTVSNPGRHGNLYGFAIINQPQVGILRMGEIAKRAVVRTLDGEDAIVIRTMMYMALSYDHRAVDGAPANGFLYRIRELLEAAEFDL